MLSKDCYLNYINQKNPFRKIVSVLLHLAPVTLKTDIYPEIFHKVRDFHHKIQYLVLRVLVNCHQLQPKQHSIHDHIHPVQIKEHYAHRITLPLNVPQHPDRLMKNWHQRNHLTEQMILFTRLQQMWLKQSWH